MSYAYCADIYCADCAGDIMADCVAKGVEDEGDTESFPQYVQNDEADTPQHCANCHVFLENELTTHGREYTIEQVRHYVISGHGNREVLDEWIEYYGIELSELMDMWATTECKHCKTKINSGKDTCEGCQKDKEDMGGT